MRALTSVRRAVRSSTDGDTWRTNSSWAPCGVHTRRSAAATPRAIDACMRRGELGAQLARLGDDVDRARAAPARSGAPRRPASRRRRRGSRTGSGRRPTRWPRVELVGPLVVVLAVGQQDRVPLGQPGPAGGRRPSRTAARPASSQVAHRRAAVGPELLHRLVRLEAAVGVHDDHARRPSGRPGRRGRPGASRRRPRTRSRRRSGRAPRRPPAWPPPAACAPSSRRCRR